MKEESNVLPHLQQILQKFSFWLCVTWCEICNNWSIIGKLIKSTVRIHSLQISSFLVQAQYTIIRENWEDTKYYWGINYYLKASPAWENFKKTLVLFFLKMSFVYAMYYDLMHPTTFLQPPIITCQNLSTYLFPDLISPAAEAAAPKSSWCTNIHKTKPESINIF